MKKRLQDNRAIKKLGETRSPVQVALKLKLPLQRVRRALGLENVKGKAFHRSAAKVYHAKTCDACGQVFTGKVCSCAENDF